MELKEQLQKLAEQVIAKLKGDGNLLASFKKEPIKTIEKIIGKDLPDEQLEKVVTLVKAKLTADKIGDKADDVKSALSGLGNLFKK